VFTVTLNIVIGMCICLKLEIYVLNIFRVNTKVYLLLKKRILGIEFIQGVLTKCQDWNAA
jgi:hypothetical protein